MSVKVIEIKNLNFTYPDGTGALDEINLEVAEGESIGIIGPNGAGKSTLLLHLNGILKGEGRVKISGLQMEEKNLPAIRRKVGLVFQDPDNQLFMPTVFDDVSFGPVNMGLPVSDVRVRVDKALEKVEMKESAGRSSHHLSFGEKKRIAIATVLSMNPEIMALDEPTSNLDPQGRCDLIHLLQKVTGTKLIASHDLDMILKLCDRVLIMDKRRIVAEGAAREILSDIPLFKKHKLVTPLCLQKSRL